MSPSPFANIAWWQINADRSRSQNMKTVSTVLLVLASFPAMSDGFGGAVGLNRLGQQIRMYEGQDGTRFSAYKPRPTEPVGSEWRLETECEWHASANVNSDPTYTFACAVDGKSPLAGTTYRATKSRSKRNSCGRPYEIYLCVRGCSNRAAPNVFYVQPWEC